MTKRRGAVLLSVLVCMGIATTMILATLQAALRARREIRLHAQIVQTDLLLDAGIMRAVQQLQQSAEYVGETWDVTASFTLFESATLQIHVAESAEENNHQIEVKARVRGAETIASQTQKTHRFSYPKSNPTNKS